MEKLDKEILIKNKRASFDYIILNTYTAGIILVGTEIKSIRRGKASLIDSFCFITEDAIWVKNMNISEDIYGSYNNHIPKRDRKLLLNKKEIRKLKGETKDTGFTIVPLKLFINDKGLAKVEIAVAKGKKSYDKRESIKERDDKRMIAKLFKK